MAQLVKIRNAGPTVWSDSFNSETVVLRPGEETVVSVEAAKLWVGDWDVQDAPPRSRPRWEEFQRLCTRYGVDPLMHTKPEDQFPRIEVYTLDGERIQTVVDDHLTLPEPVVVTSRKGRLPVDGS